MLPPDSPGTQHGRDWPEEVVRDRRAGGEQAVRYRFGDYLFDTERYELHRAGVLVPLRPKECGVLGLSVPSSAVPMPSSTGMLLA